MIYIEAPKTTSQSGLKLFLAGGITDCKDWQKEVLSQIDDLNVIVFNPRRKNFPIENPNAAFEQIKWEHDRFRESDFIAFWFCKDSICPIVLYELGAWTVQKQIPIVIGMDPDYERRKDVEVQTKLERPEVEIVYSIKDLVGQIKSLYDQMKDSILVEK